jgi:glycosyltransferase involved in cell wall biosynthesis
MSAAYRNTDVRLVLVLHDTLGVNSRDYINASLKLFNIAGKGIHILKNVSDEKLGGLYKHAEAFVFPSLYEGFGLPVIEAMAHGTPVVTSRLSCMPEITGGAAITTDMTTPGKPAKVILTLLNDKSLSKKLSEKGVKRAAFFTWEKCASSTLAVYEKLYRQRLKK